MDGVGAEVGDREETSGLVEDRLVGVRHRLRDGVGAHGVRDGDLFDQLEPTELVADVPDVDRAVPASRVSVL